jgi:hypothetical protein
MIKIHWLIAIHMLNYPSPYWFCILLFPRLDPNPHNESMCDLFNGFHNEPMYFSFLTPLSRELGRKDSYKTKSAVTR